MAEIIISAIISLVCIAPIIILGIVQYRSKNPVGFWSGKEPPEKERITDVKAYNHDVDSIWSRVYSLLCMRSSLWRRSSSCFVYH